MFKVPKKNILGILLIVCIIFFFSITFAFNFIIPTGDQQYVYLAQSFIQGKLHFINIPPGGRDVIFYNGQALWPLAPLPAVLLIPFTWLFGLFGKFFYQGYLQFFVTIGVFYFAKSIAQMIGYKKDDSLFLAFAFTFASVFQATAFVTWSWYLVQALCVFFILVAIYEYQSRKRSWVIGGLFALVLLTRPIAAMGFSFFIADLLFKRKFQASSLIKKTGLLVLPLLFGLFLSFGYNYLRFGSVYESGYSKAKEQVLGITSEYRQVSPKLFDVKNFRNNFYYYFLKTPTLIPSKLTGQTKDLLFNVGFPGVSFFIVSPLFLYIFKTDLKKRIVKLSLIPIFLTLCVLLSYYWPGWRQVGPRYLLDILPFMYILLLFAFRRFRLSNSSKVLILGSSLFNLLLFFNAFND